MPWCGLHLPRAVRLHGRRQAADAVGSRVAQCVLAEAVLDMNTSAQCSGVVQPLDALTHASSHLLRAQEVVNHYEATVAHRRSGTGCVGSSGASPNARLIGSRPMASVEPDGHHEGSAARCRGEVRKSRLWGRREVGQSRSAGPPQQKYIT